MIPDHEISVSIEHVVKSKIGTIFANKKSLKNALSKFMKLILIFISITKKKKYKLTIMIKNTYHLE